MTQQHYRWAGLAGISGAVLFIGVFVFVGVVVGADTSIAAFPGLQAGRTIENGLYLAVLALWMAPVLAIGRALRETSPGLASYGSVVSVVGLGVLASGALPHVASVPVADLFHAPGTTPPDRAALQVVWQGNQAILNMLLVTGLAIVPIGVVGLGWAMRAAPAFGSRIGTASVALGVAGLASAVVLVVDPLSPIAVIGFFALTAFNAAVGWRLYARSRVAAASGAWEPAVTGRSAG